MNPAKMKVTYSVNRPMFKFRPGRFFYCVTLTAVAFVLFGVGAALLTGLASCDFE